MKTKEGIFMINY